MAEQEFVPPPREGSDSPCQKEKVIIDCDPGVDDIFALFLAFASPELDVVGITTVAGGNGKDPLLLARNASAVAHLCGRDDVPVVAGAATCLTGVDRGSQGLDVHGRANAMGNIALPEHAHSTRPMEHCHTSAAQFLVDTCAADAGNVTLITLGPLTNIADSIRLSPTFKDSVKRIVMMGGAVAGGGQWEEFGNRAPCAEANVYNDPEAASLVFQTFERITMAGLNVTHQLSMCAVRDRLKDSGEAGRLCHAISEHYVAILQSWGNKNVGLHDPTAVLAAVCPSLFESRHVRVEVATGCPLTTGMTVVDWKNQLKKPPQTHVLMRVDVERAHDFIVERISQLKVPDLGELKPIGAKV